MEERKETEKNLSEKLEKFYSYSFYAAMLEPNNKELRKFLKIDIICSIIIAIIAIAIILWIFTDNKLNLDLLWIGLFIVIFLFGFISSILSVPRAYYFWGKFLIPKILKDLDKELDLENSKKDVRKIIEERFKERLQKNNLI
jgi:glucan phosphoethanolaminetransferase (alkaline phosphatase superfamily)